MTKRTSSSPEEPQRLSHSKRPGRARLTAAKRGRTIPLVPVPAAAGEVDEEAIFILNKEGFVVNCSAGAESVAGYSSQEVIGKPGSIFYSPQEIAAGVPEEALLRASERGRHASEGWRVRQDGTRFWAEVITAALRETDGTVRGFARIVSDRTRRMQTQTALQQAAQHSDAQVRGILEAAVDAIIIIDGRGLIKTFNRAAQRMFGYQPPEVVGRNVNVLMPQPYKSEHDSYLANYARTGKAKIIGIGREVVARKKDGTIFPIDLAVSDVRLENGVNFTGIIRDITERKRLEKEILEISEREQRRIGQDLHDGLCQQLTGIAFLMQAMQQKMAGKKGNMPSEAAQITMLLKEAVNQARNLSHGLYPVDPQPDGLMVALRELAANARGVFNVACEFRCPAPVMIADNSAATHLYRIAQESVQNAIRHGKASRITLELVPRPQGWRLSVTDNGIGFPGQARVRPGLGLRTMNHRAHVMGAVFAIRRLPKGGSRVLCELTQKM